jgi:transglutaminase-like putative cysteine protease
MWILAMYKKNDPVNGRQDGVKRINSWSALFVSQVSILLIVVSVGCGSPTTKSGSNSANSANSAAESQPTEARGTESAGKIEEESWEVFLMEGEKIGHSHTTIRQLEEPTGTLREIVSDSRTALKRFGQTVESNVKISSWEKLDGTIVRFASTMSNPPVEMMTQGKLENQLLRIEQTTLGKTQTTAMTWDPAWGGYFAQEQSLRQKPLEPGEKRTLKALAPIFNQPSEIRLVAGQYEATKLLDRTEELLRVDVTVQLGSVPIQSVIWTDRKGQTQKTLLTAQGWESYRTTRDVALAPSSPGSFDLGNATLVRVQRQIDNPHQTRRIVYRVKLKGRNPADVFASGGTQQVTKIDDETAEIEVRSVRDPRMDAEPGTEPVGDQDRQPNNLIQSDDPRIMEMARDVLPEEKDPWKVALALERWVEQKVRVTQFSQALATASDVAQSLEGDCTEHAVLLAALCRARQIPARVALGLVYYRQAGGFAYHMWTEVWVHGHWLPLDGTLGQGGIGAAHLKVSSGNLEGVAAYTALLPVLELLGKLQLEMVTVE